MAKEKKRKKKKETSGVKYNTSGHYRGRRYNKASANNQGGEAKMGALRGSRAVVDHAARVAG